MAIHVALYHKTEPIFPKGNSNLSLKMSSMLKNGF